LAVALKTATQKGTMKSYDEIDYEQENHPGLIVLKAIFIILVIMLIYHLITRYNNLHTEYTSCMELVTLYSNAWEQTR